MKTDQRLADVEIIEIIDVSDGDADDIDHHRRVSTTHDAGGPRWVGPATAAVLVGLIGYGIATSTSSGASPKAAAVTSTIAPEATLPTPTNRVSLATADAYYAADPPRRFTVESANVQALDGAPFLGYAYELWATADASATSGRWFSVATYHTSTMTAPDAYRLQAGGLSIAIAHLVAGQSVTRFTENGTLAVTVTSFGWSDDELLRLATSIQANEGSVRFTDAWFKPSHTLQSNVQPWLSVQGVPAERISYIASDDPADNIVVTVAQRLPQQEVGSATVRDTSLRFLLSPNTPFTVDGQDAVAGEIVGQEHRALATWITGDHVITVAGSMPVSSLITIARTVHQVSARDWDHMRYDAEHNQVNAARYETSVAHKLTETGLNVWVAIANVGSQKQLSWSWDGNGLATTPNGTPQINTIVDDGLTYVVADLPRSIATSVVLRVTRAGRALDVPFVEIDPTADRTFAAYGFAEPGPFTAEILDADGRL